MLRLVLGKGGEGAGSDFIFAVPMPAPVPALIPPEAVGKTNVWFVLLTAERGRGCDIRNKRTFL